MSTTVLAVLAFAVAVGLFVWWLKVLIEALRIPQDRWETAGQSQILYVLLMALTGIIGTIAYVLVARPKLR